MIWQRLIVNKLIKSDVPQVIEERCIIRKMRLMKCDYCVKKCPQGAIFVRKGSVIISEKECVGCNICNSACPTQMFIPKNISLQNKYQEIISKEHPILGCDHNDSKINITFPCLFSLNAEFLQSVLLKLASLNRRITFYFGNCLNCYNFSKYPLFMNALTKAYRLTRDLGLHIEIDSAYDTYHLESNIKFYSRRELFKGLRQNAFNTAQDISQDLLPYDESELPVSRKLLLSQLIKYKDKSINSKTPITFGILKVSSNCKNCGLCIKSCMNNALRFINDSNDLKHSPWKCFNCSICRQICPNNALTRTKFSGVVKNLFKETSIE